MASTYHFSSQPVPTGETATAHFDYINREGKYDPQKFGEDDIRAIGEGNTPEWAKTPKEFWEASDRFGRANGRSYREINIALQNELSMEDNIGLVKDFIKELIYDLYKIRVDVEMSVPIFSDKRETEVGLLIDQWNNGLLTLKQTIIGLSQYNDIINLNDYDFAVYL